MGNEPIFIVVNGRIVVVRFLGRGGVVISNISGCCISRLGHMCNDTRCSKRRFIFLCSPRRRSAAHTCHPSDFIVTIVVSSRVFSNGMLRCLIALSCSKRMGNIRCLKLSSTNHPSTISIRWGELVGRRGRL